MRVLALALAAAAAPALAVADGSPTARATASKAEVHVGETFVVEVHASGPPGTAFSFPEDPGSEAVELREPEAAASPTPAEPAGVHRYEAAAFVLGEAQVPPITVSYRLPDGRAGTVDTEPVPLQIASVLPKDPKEQKLADIRGPVPVGIGAPFWVALGCVLAVVAGLVAWIVRRRRRPSLPEAAVPPLAADVEALAALERLATASLVERGDYRAFYIVLSDVAKRYLERRLGAPVLEMTSAEMTAYLRDHPHGSPYATALRELAGAADRIKFARGDGLQDEARRHLDGVRMVVQGIEERLRPRAEEKVA